MICATDCTSFDEMSVAHAHVLDYYCLFFFFQAEAGIRAQVRSRGCGDVYKEKLVSVINRIVIKGIMKSRTMLRV